MKGSEIINKELRKAGVSRMKIAMMNTAAKKRMLSEMEETVETAKEAPSTCIKVNAEMQTLVPASEYNREGWKKPEWIGVDFKFDTPSDGALLAKQKVVLERARGYIPYTTVSGIMYFQIDGSKIKTAEMMPNHMAVLLAYFGIPSANAQPPVGTEVSQAYQPCGHTYLGIQPPAAATGEPQATSTPTPAQAPVVTTTSHNQTLSQDALKGVDMAQYGGNLPVYAEYVDGKGKKYNEMERLVLEKTGNKHEFISAEFWTATVVGGIRHRFFEEDARRVLNNLGIKLTANETAKMVSRYQKGVDLDKLSPEELDGYLRYVKEKAEARNHRSLQRATDHLKELGLNITPQELWDTFALTKK